MTTPFLLASSAALSISLLSISPSLAQEASSSGPAQLTIYNQQFALVREPIQLPLKKGTTRLTYTGATAHLEPDSVILRDPTGKRTVRILEQNYEADPVSAELLLQRFEGKTIEFLLPATSGGPERSVTGKIVRAPYVPHYPAMNRYGSQYAATQYTYSGFGASNQPIIEIDGKLRFGLPGTPLFPTLGNDVNLKPTLSWNVQADTAQTITAELAYISGGMSWEAAYSLVLPQDSDRADFTGLVTMDNQSGKSFDDARIQLMAGDISKIQQTRARYDGFARDYLAGAREPGPQVTEKNLDEYHLYTLGLPTSLKDRETKQVEFVRATGIETHSSFVYDGVALNLNQYNSWSDEAIRQQRDYGTQSNPKVWIMRQFKNTGDNGLGIALPEGKVRFYRREAATGALQFVGENRIDHTPQGESVRVYTGNAFDIVGERKQTDYVLDSTKRTLDETFQITLRNRKKTPVSVSVVEHLYRWSTGSITRTSQPFTRKDSRTIEFAVPLQPNQEQTITYNAHYTW